MATESRPNRARAARTAAASAAGDGASRLSPGDERSLESIVDALVAARDGDFSKRLPARRRDVIGDLQARVNELVEHNARMTKELQRLARVVGRDGRMTKRATLPGVYGAWAGQIEAVNALVDHLVRPTTEVRRVIAADGDLSQKMALTIEGSP